MGHLERRHSAIEKKTSPEIDSIRKRESQESLFEGQFAEKYSLIIGKKSITYTRLVPPATERTSLTPVVIGPGLTENKNMLKKLCEMLYADGREVFTLEHSRKNLHSESPGLPRVQAQKVAEMTALIDEARKINPLTSERADEPGRTVDLIGRSDGAINATLAAQGHPDWIENLILVDAPLITDKSRERLLGHLLYHAGRTAAEVSFDPKGKTVLFCGIKNATKYVLAHPFETLQEVDAIAETDIKPVLFELQRKGVHNYGVHGGNDHMFPRQSVERDIAAAQEEYSTEGPISLFDSFAMVPGKDHTAIYRDPEYLAAIGATVKAARENSELRTPLYSKEVR